MSLRTESPRMPGKPLSWNCALGIAASFFLFAVSPVILVAQTDKFTTPPTAKAETETMVDPLGRETPRSAALGFFKYLQRQDFVTASRYLQAPPGQKMDLVQLVSKFHQMHHWFKGNVGLLSDDPKGDIEAGLPPGQVRAGVLTIGTTTLDLILVRVEDPEYGKIWLLSQETVARIPELYAQMESSEPTAFDRIMPTSLTSRYLLGMSLAQWLGWLLSIPVSLLMAWLFVFLLSAARRVWYKARHLPFTTVWKTRLALPLKCIIAILVHCIFVYLLEPPILYRVYYSRLMAGLLVACFAWLVSRIIDRGFDTAVNRMQTQSGGGQSILILMQRLTHVAMWIIAFVAALALFGVNVRTTLAGLGIGGLAIALAAQKTLENILGGVTLLMDRAVQVGDFCHIGDYYGTVEDIGLRSLRLRTLAQNLLVVPNGLLAQMQFENMKARPKLLINQNFSLRIETQLAELRSVLDGVQKMLDNHPAIELETSRVKVSDFAGAAFQLELFAYVKTGDWAQFTSIRQDVILRIVEIVDAAGVRFAAPTRLTYVSQDGGVDARKARGVEAA